jgi:hypothetical protein
VPSPKDPRPPRGRFVPEGGDLTAGLVARADERAAGTTEPAAGTTEPATGITEPAAGRTGRAAGKAEPAAGTTERAAGTTGRAARTGRSGAAAARRTAPDDEGRQRIAMAAQSDYEAYRYALWRGRVTFHDVAGAWFYMSDPELTEPQREPFKQLFPGLLDAFAEPRGGIITAYFCRHLRVAAALTDIDYAAHASEGVPTAVRRPPAEAGLQAAPEGRPPGAAETHENGATETAPRRRWRWWREPAAPEDDEPRTRRHLRQSALRPFRPNPASSSAIHIEPTFGDPADWHAKALLFRCLHLHYRALEFLTPQPRKICMRLIFGVIVALLGTLDAKHARALADEPLELQTLQAEIVEAERYYDRATQRQAQLEYFVGMLMALASAGVVIGVLAALQVDPLGDPFGVSLIAGGIGGVLSVMTRMTSGHLSVRAEAGKWAIRTLGGIRPIVGAAFGAAVYLLLAGGVIDFFQAPKTGDTTLFYAGLAFLAGFSERFAQDAIAGATMKLGGTGAPAADQPPTAASSARR